MSKYKFKTEVNKLLHLIIHSLYSNKDVFLRELISNSSDAIDKIKYLSVSDEAYKNINVDFRIDIKFDAEKKILEIIDNGIGQNEEDFKNNFGTIAKSGTREFLNRITEDQKKNNGLIGQFGVGFYSAFMVADSIEVSSKKALEDKAYVWISKGEENFEIKELKDFELERGTIIKLHIKDEAVEYLNRYKIEEVSKKYSDHIAYPIFLHFIEKKYDDEGKVSGEIKKIEQINSMNALWQKNKNDLKKEDYEEFFKNNFSSQDEPFLYIHTKAEGVLEYVTLFYIPKKIPFDLYYANYQSKIKLYVKRVYISDFEKDLLPKWLRFVYGIVDSQDLELNVSREILQQNKILEKIKQASIKKILNELKKLAKEDNARYLEFIEQFNKVLKEGFYDYIGGYKQDLLELTRFKTSKEPGYISLKEYVLRKLPEQKYIYYISGGTYENLKKNPLLLGFESKGFEVLIMDDDIDDIIMPMLGTFEEMEFKSINKLDSQEELKDKDFKNKVEENKTLIEKIKNVLKDKIKDVLISPILKDTPSNIVFDSGDPTLGMQQILKTMNQNLEQTVKPILEVNPDNKIVLKIKNTNDEKEIEDLSHILLYQAVLNEAGTLEDPIEFTSRLNNIMEKLM